MNRSWTQRDIVRFALGAYLCVHYVQLLPYAAELFSDQGAFVARASPFFGRVLNPLFVLVDPAFARVLVAGAAMLAALLACGVAVRAAAFAGWAISAFLYTRNPLIANPALPFIGLLLLVYATFPDNQARWRRLGSDYGLVFVVMALAYTYSGLTKLASPSWLDGSALRHVLENPLARPNALRNMLLATPAWLLQVSTYLVLALELSFAPLCLWRNTRRFAWCAMVARHVGILLLVDFADLTLGMLLVHAFTFDSAWFEGVRRRSVTVGVTQYGK